LNFGNPIQSMHLESTLGIQKLRESENHVKILQDKVKKLQNLLESKNLKCKEEKNMMG